MCRHLFDTRRGTAQALRRRQRRHDLAIVELDPRHLWPTAEQLGALDVPVTEEDALDELSRRRAPGCHLEEALHIGETRGVLLESTSIRLGYRGIEPPPGTLHLLVDRDEHRIP